MTNEIKMAIKNENIKNLDDLKSFMAKLVFAQGDDVFELKMSENMCDIEKGFWYLTPDGCEVHITAIEDGKFKTEWYVQGYRMGDAPDEFENIDELVKFIIDYPELLELRCMIPSSIPSWTIIK